MFILKRRFSSIIRGNFVLLIQRVFGKEFQSKYFPSLIERQAIAKIKYEEITKELLKLSENELTINEKKTIENITEKDLSTLTIAQLKTLGDLRFKGEKLSQDLQLAVKAWKLASEQGDIESSYSYAASLRAGKGIEANHPEALRIFNELATKHNHVFSHVSLNLLF